jgi:PHD/YefM family antitoxin component YafN of YafNO toxin-antitoxin module
MAMELNRVPRIDPNVEYVGVTKLRQLNSTELRDVEKTLVIQDNDKPLAVLLKYEQFLIMQNELDSLLQTIYVLMSQGERAEIAKGIEQFKAGQGKNVDEIRAALKTKTK